MRLAYQDLEQQRKKDEQKLKNLDGKKREQAERLGMGLSVRRCARAAVFESACSALNNSNGCFSRAR